MRTRAELLTELADAINELTEPHTITEYREVTITEQQITANGRRRKAKRTRRRQPHHVTLPGLIDALHTAAVPGSTEPGGNGGSFESRPSAELEPLSVLREITDDLGWYARRYDLDRATITATLHALVSLHTDDNELTRITRQAQRWVRRARIATGLDLAPITLNQPCPYCHATNAITVTAELTAGRCQRCGVEWTPDTIGLLADMIRTNQTQTTALDVRCWMADCKRRGLHDQHEDDRGRTWRREDRCLDEHGVPLRAADACG